MVSRKSALPLAALAFCLAYALLNWHGRTVGDFHRFWLVGQMFQKTSITDIYAPSNEAEIKQFISAPTDSPQQTHARQLIRYDEFYSTPFLYWVINKISFGTFEADYQRFRMASATLFFLGLATFFYCFKISPWPAIAFTLLFTFFYWPIRLDTEVGNVTQIQLGLLGLFFLALHRKRLVLAGLFLAVVTAFKPSVILIPFYLFLYWLISGTKKELIRTSVGLAIGMVVIGITTVFYWGPYCSWSSWFNGFVINVVSKQYMTQGIMVTNSDRHAFHHGSLLGLAILFYSGVILWLKKKQPNPSYLEPLCLVLGLGTYLIAGPLVQVHYYVLAIPIILWIFRPSPFYLKDMTIPRNVACIGTGLIALGPGYFNDTWRLFVGAVLLMAVVTYDLFSRMRTTS